MRNRRGWWKVHDSSGEIKVRAWAGIWWTPLSGGWISSPTGYEPIKWLCKMEPANSKMDPLDEMNRAAGKSSESMK